ncbi:MAG: acetyl-coenzyme A synthetase N-terminal domain-containing protein, partial [Pseudomonadota bacterium]
MPDTARKSATHAPSSSVVSRAHVDASGYEALYAASMTDPEAFWAEKAQRIDWITPFTQVSDVDFTLGQVSINWFADGTLNVAANCIDRHLETRADQTAIIWEPDDPADGAQHISYAKLHEEVCKFANVLKSMGVSKGDRVVI